MRTAKYHDYTLLRILLFIILVILGWFAYKHFVKAPCEHVSNNGWVTVKATCTEDGYRYKVCTECGEQFGNQKLAAHGHKAMKGVKENEKAHTLTEGGSYEFVIYCKECGEELSRETVMVNGAHTPKIVETKEVVEEPTCTESGAYDLVKTCAGCGEEISRVSMVEDPKGHDFEWKLEVGGTHGVVLVGECKDPECDYTYDPEVDTDYTYKVTSLKPVCYDGENTFTVEVFCKGEKVDELTLEVKVPVFNHTILTDSGEEVDISVFALTDENGRVYYNISTPGITLVYEREEGQTQSEAMAAAWDENGFALGVFKCCRCGNWIVVNVYNDLA